MPTSWLTWLFKSKAIKTIILFFHLINQIMKIKFGAIVTDGRNKIGGHVASKNKAGNYLKTKSTPTNPNTSYQSAVRQKFGSIAQAWRGLTQAQRDTWIAGASNFPYTDIFGDTKILSGFGLYMQLNSNLKKVGVAFLNSCPSPTTVSSIISLNVTNDPGATLTCDFTPTPVPANHKIVISATAPLSEGRAFSKSDIRQIQYFAAAVATPVDIYDEYVARFGETVANMKVFASAYLVNTNTGQVSPALTVLVEPA